MASEQQELIIKLKADLDQYVKSIKTAGQVTEDMQKQVNTQLTRVAESVKKANSQGQNLTKGLGNLGKTAGQAGIQVQQFVGQLQGGQSVFVAFSQQAADLGFVLGAPLLGALVSIGAVIAGTILPNLFKTEEGFKDLTDRILDNVEAINKLTVAQRAAVEFDLTKRIEEQLKVFRETEGQIADLKEDLEDVSNLEFGDALGIFDALGDSLDELRGKPRTIAEELLALESKSDTTSKKIFELKNILAILTGEKELETAASKKLVEQLDKEFQIRLKAAKNIIVTGGESPEIQAAVEKQARLLAIEQQSFEEQKAILGENFEAIQLLTQLHEENLTKIRENGSNERERILKSEEARERVSAAIRLGTITQTLNAAKSLASAAFEDSKLINAGFIAADTFVGVQRALTPAFPGAPPNVAAATFIALAGAINVAKTLGTQKGGASASGGAGGVGGSSPSAAQPDLASSPSSIGVSVSEPSPNEGTQNIVISTEDGENIFEGIARKTKQLEEDGIV